MLVNRVLQGAVSRFYDATTAHGAALLKALIDRQAQIIAYNNDFYAMTFVVVPPLLFLRRAPPARVVAPPKPAAAE